MSKRRSTFRQLVEETRRNHAVALFDKAKRYSEMRHLARKCRDLTGARVAGDRKMQAIVAAIQLAPEEITVTIDDDYQLGMISVRWPGHGRLHLPKPPGPPPQAA